jgi:hypothetical protein
MLMGVGRLIALLSWVPTRSRLVFEGGIWCRSKHHSETGSQVLGLGVQVWAGT